MLQDLDSLSRSTDLDEGLERGFHAQSDVGEFPSTAEGGSVQFNVHRSTAYLGAAGDIADRMSYIAGGVRSEIGPSDIWLLIVAESLEVRRVLR
jgi:hypothetical protein